ncbi:MAG: hypothetical protein KGY41_10810 [Desulfovermiculus sp.]|nr:hypothetical protein [Desulfovermiculus sp.]
MKAYIGGFQGGIQGAYGFSSAVHSGGVSGDGLINIKVEGVDQFCQDLNTINRQVQHSIDVILRKAIIDQWMDLVDNNPVDTGRSRAGWIVSGGSPSTYEPPEGQGSYDVSPDQVAPPAHASIFYVVNNVEYISVLNDGHSSQAPVGCVDSAVANFQDYLQQALLELPNSDWFR